MLLDPQNHCAASSHMVSYIPTRVRYGRGEQEYEEELREVEPRMKRHLRTGLSNSEECGNEENKLEPLNTRSMVFFYDAVGLVRAHLEAFSISRCERRRRRGRD